MRLLLLLFFSSSEWWKVLKRDAKKGCEVWVMYWSVLFVFVPFIHRRYNKMAGACWDRCRSGLCEAIVTCMCSQRPLFNLYLMFSWIYTDNGVLFTRKYIFSTFGTFSRILFNQSFLYWTLSSSRRLRRPWTIKSSLYKSLFRKSLLLDFSHSLSFILFHVYRESFGYFRWWLTKGLKGENKLSIDNNEELLSFTTHWLMTFHRLTTFHDCQLCDWQNSDGTIDTRLACPFHFIVWQTKQTQIVDVWPSLFVLLDAHHITTAVNETLKIIHPNSNCRLSMS